MIVVQWEQILSGWLLNNSSSLLSSLSLSLEGWQRVRSEREEIPSWWKTFFSRLFIFSPPLSSFLSNQCVAWYMSDIIAFKSIIFFSLKKYCVETSECKIDVWVKIPLSLSLSSSLASELSYYMWECVRVKYFILSKLPFSLLSLFCEGAGEKTSSALCRRNSRLKVNAKKRKKERRECGTMWMSHTMWDLSLSLSSPFSE